jgi:hypothetical protein
VGRLLLWLLAALAAGVVAGALGGLLRRRASPEAVSYVAPTPARGREAVGPHRAVLRG